MRARGLGRKKSPTKAQSVTCSLKPWPYLHGPFFRQSAEPVLKRLSTSADNFLVLVEESLPGSQRVSARWISSCCVRRSSFARAQSPNDGGGRRWLTPLACRS